MNQTIVLFVIKAKTVKNPLMFSKGNNYETDRGRTAKYKVNKFL